MDIEFWEKIASFWSMIATPQDKAMTRQTIDTIFTDSLSQRQKERSIQEELLLGLDEEDDDDGY